ncbi:12906_t:CDS:2 [Entrophospora sp. SA101]|nr:2570_t:CDS:2 [Entrophospora sp. SA101]CAJ0830283.1 1809_t:CDS:2 [Entrophospora sp. SA101]CAJ0831192.1 2641_t:CDS:2 [Entrophospora sp. SA101]CAJ0894975.1 12906_t:CDS:2 [Entrophospora sp. SA101]
MNYTPKELKQAYQLVTQDLFNRLIKAKNNETIQIGSMGSLGSLKKTEGQMVSHMKAFGQPDAQFQGQQSQTQAQFQEQSVQNQTNQQPTQKEMLTGQKIPPTGVLADILKSLENNASNQLTNLSQQVASTNKSFHLLATETKRSLEFNPRPQPEFERNYNETE